jgi:beta-lactam-binding protein with PASTA domain
VPVDDDFGLLPDQQGAPPPPRRPMGLVLGGLVVVALAAVAAVFWMVASLADRSRTVTAVGTPSPAAATTPAPTPETSTPPVATVPPTTAAPTSVAPIRSAATIVPTRTAPKPTPAPTTRPVPPPTASVPVARLVRVPDVTGLRVQRAGTVLRAAGFRVQVIGGVQDPERDDRRVVAQRPTAGSVVSAGSTVILVTDGT